jgi:hypothetical protein
MWLGTECSLKGPLSGWHIVLAIERIAELKVRVGVRRLNAHRLAELGDRSERVISQQRHAASQIVLLARLRRSVEARSRHAEIAASGELSRCPFQRVDVGWA